MSVLFPKTPVFFALFLPTYSVSADIVIMEEAGKLNLTALCVD